MNPADGYGVIDTLPERKYLRQLLMEMPPDQPVVLVGSWARGTAISPFSDIDVVVIGTSPPVLAPPRIQMMVIAPEELRRRLMIGDDFPQWALRFGVPIYGRASWDALRATLLSVAPWPDPTKKLDQAKRKRDVAKTLLDMGDVPAAEEEARFALSHLARARLLSAHVFPLSRPELPSQVGAIGDADLAALMSRANSPEPMTEQEVRNAILFVDQRLRTETFGLEERASTS
jgi:predicted nucleotidyltransferase